MYHKALNGATFKALPGGLTAPGRQRPQKSLDMKWRGQDYFAVWSGVKHRREGLE